jgi:pantoate--beta-alanine ligase
MIVTRTVTEVRAALARSAQPWPRPLGLVPTMGALHAGHRALLESARAECRTVVMTLFVNPTQFSDQTDLATYPRDEPADLAFAEAAGVDLVFAPTPDEMYPPGFQTHVDVDALGAILEGAHRPGHFRGVATVVSKLFHLIDPDVAYFGQKDAQQVSVVRALVRDLDLALTLRVMPTVRDPDGLAVSSRNVHLSSQERARALAVPRALAAGLAAARAGNDPLPAARAILAAQDGLAVEYLELADLDGPTLVVAARAGGTRLIDNVRLDVEGDPFAASISPDGPGPATV